ncbi:MAG: hypothetical protein ACRDQ5_01440 [Sciscionella sp.]
MLVLSEVLGEGVHPPPSLYCVLSSATTGRPECSASVTSAAIRIVTADIIDHGAGAEPVGMEVTPVDVIPEV